VDAYVADFSNLAGFDPNFVDDKFITVYPNPATDHLFIQIYKSYGFLRQVKILDLSGKICCDLKYPANTFIPETQLRIGNLACGIYILQIQTESEAMAIRLIKE